VKLRRLNSVLVCGTNMSHQCRLDRPVTSTTGIQTTDVLELGWTRAADAVKSGCHLKLDPLSHRQTVEDIMSDCDDAVKLAGTENQTGGGHLMSDLCQYSIQDSGLQVGRVDRSS